MYGFFVFMVLALGFRVAWGVVEDVLGMELPAHVSALLVAAAAVGVVTALDYSVFTAFDVTLRNEAVDRIANGVALIAGASAFDAVVGRAKSILG